MVEKARLGRFDAIISRALVGHEGGLRTACGAFQPESWFPRNPLFKLKEFPVKKIALSVVIASTFALAACGGGAANNTATADQNAMQNAVDTMNAVAANAQDQAAAVANEVGAAANQATAAAHDAANAATAAAANATNAAAGH
jgi:hypothetical protein